MSKVTCVLLYTPQATNVACIPGLVAERACRITCLRCVKPVPQTKSRESSGLPIRFTQGGGLKMLLKI